MALPQGVLRVEMHTNTSPNALGILWLSASRLQVHEEVLNVWYVRSAGSSATA